MSVNEIASELQNNLVLSCGNMNLLKAVNDRAGSFLLHNDLDLLNWWWIKSSLHLNTNTFFTPEKINELRLYRIDNAIIKLINSFSYL